MGSVKAVPPMPARGPGPMPPVPRPGRSVLCLLVHRRCCPEWGCFARGPRVPPRTLVPPTLVGTNQRESWWGGQGFVLGPCREVGCVFRQTPLPGVRASALFDQVPASAFLSRPRRPEGLCCISWWVGQRLLGQGSGGVCRWRGVPCARAVGEGWARLRLPEGLWRIVSSPVCM